MKKLICIVVTIIITITMLSFPSIADTDYVAYIGQTGYTTLDDAVTAANASAQAVTIDVCSDFQKTGDGKPFNLTNDMTIDFHGYKFVLNGNQAFNVTASNKTITIKNGSITVNYLSIQSHFIFKCTNSGSILNVNDFSVEMNNVVPYSGGYSGSFNAENGAINLDNVTYNNISIRSSIGGLFASRNSTGLTVRNSVFNCNYKTPLFVAGSATANIELYNSVFKQIDKNLEFTDTSRITDINSFIPSNCTLQRNEYDTGFTVVCNHVYDSNDKCIYCHEQKKLLGDTNDDEIIDAKDALQLKKYLADWNVTVNKTNSNVTGNSEPGLKDLLKLKKFLANQISILDPKKEVNTDNGDEIKTIHFNFSTPGPTGTTTDRGAILLPKGYSKTGTPTRLVIDCHGYSIVIDERRAYLGSDQTVDSFVHAGFAVLQTAALNFGHCAGKYAVQAIINSYKYVIDRYNLYDEVYVNGNSMGGITSINLVCSGEIPVLAQTLHYPISSTYRQTYTNGWIADLRKLTANYAGFTYDEYNQANDTNYTYSTFPFTSTKDQASDAELELYRYNFFDNIANKYSIFKYTNILSEDGKSFNEGFEDFLTEFDSEKVDEMYSKISVNYPVPVFFTQCLNDTDKNVWAQKLVKSMQNGNSEVSYEWFEGTKHGGTIGPQMTYTAKDGTEMTVYKSGYTLAKFFLEKEEALGNK